MLFVQIPLAPYDIWAIDQVMPQICARGIALILTPEPTNGLDAVTDRAINQLVDKIVIYENKGAIVILRFGHEMNGSWYPWGQQPIKYKAAFERVAKILKARTKRATMLWAPNVGPGYPYLDGKYQFNCTARPADCKELDTNADGKVTDQDDMFSPYWPKDEYVDWVGTSLYWWGDTWPWGENEVPTPTFFSDVLLGSAKNDNNINVPDFYDTYAEKKQKAMVVTETAALYNLCDKNPNSVACKNNAAGIINPSEFKIKKAWWEQVYANKGPYSIYATFPKIKLISWFNIKKVEPEAAGNTVDWTVSEDKAVKTAFDKHIKTKVWANGGSKKFWLDGKDFKKQMWGKP